MMENVEIRNFVEFNKQYFEYITEEINAIMINACQCEEKLDRKELLGKGRTMLKNYLELGLGVTRKVGQYDERLKAARTALKEYDKAASIIINGCI